MEKMECVVAQERDQTPVHAGCQVQKIGKKRRRPVLVIDDRHQDVLNNVEQNIRREKGSDRHIKAVSELQDLGASRAAWWSK